MSFEILISRKGHPNRDNDRRIFEAMTSTKEQCSLNITFQSPKWKASAQPVSKSTFFNGNIL